MSWKQQAGLAVVALAMFWACDEGGNTTGQSTSGMGEGGCPSGPPEALFRLEVRAKDGPLPPDTTVSVRWSAGEEPTFVLADKDTWKTLDQGSNMECQLDPQAPVPSDLEVLRCELWTSSATEIEVTAEGYVPIEETAQPMAIDGCETPVPSVVALELTVDHDAGAR